MQMAGTRVGRLPFRAEIADGLHEDLARVERGLEVLDARLDLAARDLQVEIADADLEQVLVRQRFPALRHASMLADLRAVQLRDTLASMADTEELFRERITLLAIARTLAPGETIRGASFVDTVAAPSSDQGLPHISIDLAKELSSREQYTGPDLAIVRTIGEGGMGRVHLARQRSLDRDVAVKTLKEDASPAATAGLFREARLTGALEHPGVIPVHALGVDARGGPLLVMKRVEGVDWATLLGNAEHPLWAILTANVDRLAANLGILTHVCRTIEFAHSRGILHRDIKPENVMVGSYGEVYLVDWGIATPLEGPSTTEGIAGTPAYMAPEMFFGAKLDERTDVYLLGATLHEVLTGRSRHDGRDIMQVLHSVAASKPVAYDASVPELLGALCNAATAFDRAERPKDVRAFRDQIAEFLQRRSALALSDAASERLSLLNRLLGGATATEAPSDLAGAYRLATEARFGFVQSLREHPNNAAASAGLRASILALVELEMRQKHADTAEALLREVDSPDPSLFVRLAAVRAEDETRRVRPSASRPSITISIRRSRRRHVRSSSGRWSCWSGSSRSSPSRRPVESLR